MEKRVKEWGLKKWIGLSCEVLGREREKRKRFKLLNEEKNALKKIIRINTKNKESVLLERENSESKYG